MQLIRTTALLTVVLSAAAFATTACAPDQLGLIPIGEEPNVPPPPPPVIPPPSPPSPPPDGPALPPAPPPSGLYAKSYGTWTPTEFDSCTKEQHDAYRTVGPDGKYYPTWHPPIDPASGCTFGHEHGADPSQSALFDLVGPVPFGLANEQLDIYDPGTPRHEDHVGHKVEYANALPMRDGNYGDLDVTCDYLVKLHQGTHSKDAFTNNLHELAYHVRCSNGVEIHSTLMSPIGPPGAFTISCRGNTSQVAGPATPVNSPGGIADSKRRIPDATCLTGSTIFERWATHTRLWAGTGANRKMLAWFDPYFFVSNPSRVYAPDQPNMVARPVDQCGIEGVLSVRSIGEYCQELRAATGLLTVPWNDPRSPFTGTKRFVAANRIAAFGREHTVWFANPFGVGARPDSFPGAIRIFVAGDTRYLADGRLQGTKFGDTHLYSGNGVHAPN